MTAKLKELQEAYNLAKAEGDDEAARFWNIEVLSLLLVILHDLGTSETNSRPDSRKHKGLDSSL